MREIRIPKKPPRYVEPPENVWDNMSLEEMERHSRRREKWEAWVVAMNVAGRELAKAGQIEDAIEIYEESVEAKVDTPGTYRGLLRIYRRMKDRDNQIRVCKAAIRNVPADYRGEFEAELEALAT